MFKIKYIKSIFFQKKKYNQHVRIHSKGLSKHEFNMSPTISIIVFTFFIFALKTFSFIRVNVPFSCLYLPLSLGDPLQHHQHQPQLLYTIRKQFFYFDSLTYSILVMTSSRKPTTSPHRKQRPRSTNQMQRVHHKTIHYRFKDY